MYFDCGTMGLFDDLDLPTHTAFQLVAPAARIAAEQLDAQLLATGLYLTYGLARMSDTTEVSPELDSYWATLSSAVARHTLGGDLELYWSELKSWYRR